jgi:thiamine biosynthesis lipoprotein
VTDRGHRLALAGLALVVLGAAGWAIYDFARGGPAIYRSEADPVMGSAMHLTVVMRYPNQNRAQAALDAGAKAALDLEKKISKYDATSEVRRAWEAKPGESLPVSAETFRALELSKELWKRSGGAFDCTVQPLIELYKFTGKEERMPTDAELAAARARVGSDKLVLDPAKRTVASAAPGMKIDLGAVGQGLGADVACEALRRAGAESALVELGGEVRAFGHKPEGSPWNIAIVHPRAPKRTMAIVQLDGNAVSTSGDYEKYFLTAEGAAPAPVDSRLTTTPRKRRASHILDARTGKPLVGGAISVTIIAPDCALADGLATAVSALGPVEGMKLVESYNNSGTAQPPSHQGDSSWCLGGKGSRTVEALIIEETADGRLVPHLSPGLAGKLEIDLEPFDKLKAPSNAEGLPAAAPAGGTSEPRP